MEINADFEKKAVVHSDQLEWLASPMKGVWRRPLDRVGDEVARATTIVRYDAGSSFAPHVHSGGEEFLVLNGVFQDETGDFPAGSYVRNPPQSSHKPSSLHGCTILVKLWQFHPDDRTSFHTNIDELALQPEPKWTGVRSATVYTDDIEHISIYELDANAQINLDSSAGLEVFTLAGSARQAESELSQHSWLRSPVGSHVDISAGPDGVRLWVKQGHLTDISRQLDLVKNASSGIIA